MSPSAAANRYNDKPEGDWTDEERWGHLLWLDAEILRLRDGHVTGVRSGKIAYEPRWVGCNSCEIFKPGEKCPHMQRDANLDVFKWFDRDHQGNDDQGGSSSTT